MTSAGPSCGHSLGGSLTNMTKVGGGSAGLCGSGQPTCAGAGGIDRPIFDKDFECSVCLDDMRPPIKIFQCRNGHVMCESCKNHPEVVTCPTCRIPLPGMYHSLLDNEPNYEVECVIQQRSINTTRISFLDFG